MKPSAPASIVAYKLYGVHRSVVLHILQHVWNPTAHIDLLSECKMNVMSVSHFATHSHEGMLHREAKSYQIVYHRCNRWEALHSDSQLLISYREAKPEYNLPAYALVTIPFELRA